jgi:hypothetical protein
MTRPPSWAIPLTMLGIMIVAAYVRFPNSDLTPFAADQARDSHLARLVASGQAFPLVGVEVAGSAARTWGPLYFYLLAPAFAVSRDPTVAVWTLSALTLASVWFAYRLGQAMFGVEAGLVTAALFATYPRVVLMERWLSNLTVVPLLTILFVHALFSLVEKGRSVMFVPAMAALAALLHFHLSAISLVLVLCLSLVLFRPPLRSRHLLAGIAVAAILFSPFLVAQLRNGFTDISLLIASATGEVRPRYAPDLGRLAAEMLITFPAELLGILSPHPVVHILNRLETWAFAAGLGYVCLAALAQWLRPRGRSPRRCADTLMAFWLIVPLLMLGQKSIALPYYFELLYPAPIIAGAALASAALRRVTVSGRGSGAYGHIVVGVLVGAVVVSQVYFHRAFWRTVEETGAIRGQSGNATLEFMPIRYKQRLVASLVDGMGVDREGFFQRVHGSLFQDLLEDQGYFFEAVSQRASPSRPPRDPLLHYAVERGRPGGPDGRRYRVLTVGPYSITEYRSRIDYAGWRCAYGHASTPGADETRWESIRLPASVVPDPSHYRLPAFREWRSLPVYCRGVILLEAGGSPRHQVVASIRTSPSDEFNRLALSLNGAEIGASLRAARASFGSLSQDATFDLSEALRVGPNEIGLRIDGRNLRFDLDLHEVGERAAGDLRGG